MKHLVSFQALGLAVVPWSVPEIGVNRQGAKPVRFTRRAKKDKLHLGSASLETWKQHVATAAREAMATIPRPAGPIKIYIEFYTRTPKGKRHGQLWEVPLRWNDESGEFTKTQPRGKPEADLINMFKGTEDALQGVVCENDVQSRIIEAVALYGLVDGVHVDVYLVEPCDFAGTGEPIE